MFDRNQWRIKMTTSVPASLSAGDVPVRAKEECTMRTKKPKPTVVPATQREQPAALDVRPGESGRSVAIDGDRSSFAAVGGSQSEAFNSTILRETLATIWVPGGENDGMVQRTRAGYAALAAFKPKDEIESMLAAQAVALHFGAMECFRRAMIPDQPPEITTRLRKDGANLARAMTDMLEALDRKRGKGPQVVRVERVVVQEGAQAIVGNVQTGDGPTLPGMAPQPSHTLDLGVVQVREPVEGRGE
jgi:hypothetical protein